MIQVDTEIFGASYTGGTFSPTVFYENSTGCERPVCPSWITCEDIGAGQEGTTYVASYRFIVAANTGSPRADRIQFQCTDTGGQTWVNYINVTQGCGLFVSSSIWKDTYYYASNVSEFSYSIRTDGVDVYYGKAYCKPGDGGCYVQVNKICQNYLKNVLGDFRGYDDDVVENAGAVREFSLCDEYGAEMMNYRFLLDYASDWVGESIYSMSEPINGHLDPRMKMLYTEYGDSQRGVVYLIYEGDDEYFDVTPRSLVFQATGGTGSVIVNSISTDWNVVTDSSFLNITRNGLGFSVNCPNNTTANNRDAQIIVEEGGSSVVVSVIQYSHTLEVSPGSVTFDATGGSVTVSVTASTPYTATTQNVWMSVTNVGSTGFTIVCQPWSSPYPRYGAVTVKLDGIDKSVDVNVVHKRTAQNNKIFYTSTNRMVVVPNSTAQTSYGANYISNTYANGRGVIEFDGDVQIIGNGVFSGNTTLRSIKLPDTILSIGSGSFSGCTNLEDVTLPYGLTDVYPTAFRDCTSLYSITSPSLATPSIRNDSFRNIRTGGTLHIPAASDYSLWMSAEPYYLGYYNWTFDNDIY